MPRNPEGLTSLNRTTFQRKSSLKLILEKTTYKMYTYDIEFYRDDDGSEPVRAYIEQLVPDQKIKILAYLKVLAEFGPSLKRPYADNLGGGLGLWELRPARHRIIYFYHERTVIVLAHVFLKRTDAIPSREIAMALKRKTKYMDENT